MKQVDICLNGKDWVPVNKFCVEKMYSDEMKYLYIICDELAEMTQKDNATTEQMKEINTYKDEILYILGSLAQLGRSAGIILDICTQKPLVNVVPSILKSNLGQRIQAGRATDVMASKTALDSSIGVTIDSTHKGAGIYQTDGIPIFLRNYYSTFEWLADYYEKRGLDSLGYSKGDKQDNLKVSYEKLSGDIELSRDDNIFTVEVDNEKEVVDNRKNQEWTEI